MWLHPKVSGRFERVGIRSVVNVQEGVHNLLLYAVRNPVGVVMLMYCKSVRISVPDRN